MRSEILGNWMKAFALEGFAELHKVELQKVIYKEEMP